MKKKLSSLVWLVFFGSVLVVCYSIKAGLNLILFVPKIIVRCLSPMLEVGIRKIVADRLHEKSVWGNRCYRWMRAVKRETERFRSLARRISYTCSYEIRWAKEECRKCYEELKEGKNK